MLFAIEYTEVSGGNSTQKPVAHLVNTKETTSRYITAKIMYIM